MPLRPTSDSRRDFLKSSTLATAALGTLAVPRSVHAGVDETLKIGLVGCGGRGKGAVGNALKADPYVQLVAICDIFPDNVEKYYKSLQKQAAKQAEQNGAAAAPQINVTPERCFSDFDGYRQLLQTDVDVVILATPPHFRPAQYRAAVEAGKHTFVEKPIAVDAPGVRHVLETNEIARQKKLNVVSGLCWRYDFGVRETMRKILEDKAIGDVIAIQSNYNAGPLWHRGNKLEWSRMEYQIRNWLYYAWLSGDHNVEQHVHSLDKTAWMMGDASPVRAMGLGGRQQRTETKYGHIFDHHAVAYEYDNGARVFSYCRQQANTTGDVDEYVLGTEGQAQVLAHSIQGAQEWKYDGPKPNMYDQEHKELFAAIRAGTPIHNGHYMANSTMIAIMGRMCTYTGQTLTWDEAINSQERLGPTTYEWGEVPEPEVAIPGKTKFV